MVDLETTVQRLAKLKAKMAALEMEKKNLEASIKKAVKPGSRVTLRNGYAVTVSKESVQTRFNSSIFKEKHPELYGAYANEVKVAPRVIITAPMTTTPEKEI